MDEYPASVYYLDWPLDIRDTIAAVDCSEADHIIDMSEEIYSWVNNHSQHNHMSIAECMTLVNNVMSPPPQVNGHITMLSQRMLQQVVGSMAMH